MRRRSGLGERAGTLTGDLASCQMSSATFPISMHCYNGAVHVLVLRAYIKHQLYFGKPDFVLCLRFVLNMFNEVSGKRNIPSFIRNQFHGNQFGLSR